MYYILTTDFQKLEVRLTVIEKVLEIRMLTAINDDVFQMGSIEGTRRVGESVDER